MTLAHRRGRHVRENLAGFNASMDMPLSIYHERLLVMYPHA